MPHLRYLLTLLLLCLLHPLLAQQAAQSLRLELPLRPEDGEVEVIALPDSSLLVYHKIADLWETKATFHFTKYNHRLEPVWTDTATLAPDAGYIRYFTEAPYTYLVFGGDDLQEYTFVRIDHRSGAARSKMIELEAIDAVYEFNVLQGNYFVIGRNRRDQKPLLLYVNPDSAAARLLPSVYGDESSFSDLHTDPVNERIDAVITESNGRISRLQVKTFNKYGKLLNNYFILQKEDKSLLNAELTPGDSTTKLLIGTYGTRDLRYNQGFFTTPLRSNLMEGANFYTMLQLQNFLKYMSPRREERTRRRESRRLKGGRAPGYQYRLLLHDLIVTPTGYVLAAEAYYPQYNSPAPRVRSLDRAMTLMQGQEGYKRTHAVALGFDKNGVLLWDNTFPLPGITTFSLVHTVEVQHCPDGRVVMAYPENDKIMYHVMEQENYRDEETELELLPPHEDEKILSTSQSGIIRWYGNHMLAFGFQRIKRKGGSTREVYHLSKITF